MTNQSASDRVRALADLAPVGGTLGSTVIAKSVENLVREPEGWFWSAFSWEIPVVADTGFMSGEAWSHTNKWRTGGLVEVVAKWRFQEPRRLKLAELAEQLAHGLDVSYLESIERVPAPQPYLWIAAGSIIGFGLRDVFLYAWDLRGLIQDYLVPEGKRSLDLLLATKFDVPAEERRLLEEKLGKDGFRKFVAAAMAEYAAKLHAKGYPLTGYISNLASSKFLVSWDKYQQIEREAKKDLYVAIHQELGTGIESTRSRWIKVDLEESGSLNHVDEDSMALKDALSRLAERDERIIRLRYFEGRNDAQIARALGISQPAVFKARKKAEGALRAYLTE